MNFYRNSYRNMNRFFCCLALSVMTTMGIYAQNGTNSPYSMYGLGDLADQGVGFNKAMSGTGLAFRKGNEVNPLNPASYSAVDSLSMIIDAGLYGQITKYNENGTKMNAKGGGFDYVTGLFRVFKNVGVNVGIMPFSNIGYSYSSTTKLDDMNTTVPVTYEGNGGLHQLFLGAGFKVLKPLSLGFNFAYVWGEYDRTVTSTNTSINVLSRQYTASINSWKLDVGLQFDQPINKTDFITLGATFSPGHSLKADPECNVISRNTSIGKSDTTSYVIHDALDLPTSYGIGLAYRHGAILRVGADFQMQKWGSLKYPTKDATNDYVLKEGLLKDSYKLNAGIEWMPNPSSRKFLNHVRYRIGAGYSTPYYYINGQEGPKDFHLSFGFGIPIMNVYNSRSLLNISAQWQRRSADNLITENTFRINIGLTFNERWFAKWKIE